MPGWCPGGRSPPRSVGRLAPLLGDRRRRQPDFLVRQGPAAPPAGPARDRRGPHRPGVPAHRADPRSTSSTTAGRTRTTSAGATACPAPRSRSWPEMRLPPDASGLRRRSAAPVEQSLPGELIRSPHAHRASATTFAIPLMGSTGMPFARNVEFEATFPELGRGRARPEPARRAPRPAAARPAGDQPPAASRAARRRRPTRVTTAVDCPATPPRRTATTRRRPSSTSSPPSGSSS